MFICLIFVSCNEMLVLSKCQIHPCWVNDSWFCLNVMHDASRWKLQRDETMFIELGIL